MGPLEASKPWNTKDIAGLFRFLQRAWRVLVDEQTGTIRVAPAANPALEKTLTRTIHKVGQDIERLAFNTAIAAIIGLVNEAMSASGEKGPGVFTAEQIERFCVMLCPLAPHMSEEVWDKLGLTQSRGCCSDQRWPSIDESLLVDDSVEIPVQIQGKIKARIHVPTGADQKTTEALARAPRRREGDRRPPAEESDRRAGQARQPGGLATVGRDLVVRLTGTADRCTPTQKTENQSHPRPRPCSSPPDSWRASRDRCNRGCCTPTRRWRNRHRQPGGRR